LEKKSTDIERRVERVMRIWNIKLVLDDTGEVENAGKKLRESRECYDILFREDNPHNRRRQYNGAPLLWAAEDGYITVVDKLLVNHGIDPNSKYGKDGRAALSYAAENGQEAIVQYLITIGKAEVDSLDGSKMTPLLYAARKGQEAIVQYLITTGKAKVDSRDVDMRTPLSYAAGNGHAAIVQHLLATGNVEVESKDEDGRTPLSYAVEKGYTAVAQQLRGFGLNRLS
jgi:ankyrin repeat protein